MIADIKNGIGKENFNMLFEQFSKRDKLIAQTYDGVTLMTDDVNSIYVMV